MCTDNSTTTEEFHNNSASVYHDQYVQYTCSVSYTGNWPPTIKWIDGNGQTVNNATVIVEYSQVVSSILIPCYFPSIKPFTCIVTGMFFSFNSNNCTSKSIAVGKWNTILLIIFYNNTHVFIRFMGDRTKWYRQNGTDKMVTTFIDSNSTELNF